MQQAVCRPKGDDPREGGFAAALTAALDRSFIAGKGWWLFGATKARTRFLGPQCM